MNTRWLRTKYVVFGFIFFMMAYVLYHNEGFLIHPSDPIWNHYEAFKWWLLPHGVAGACTLVLAPMEFSDRLRRRYTRLHRVMGRMYVASVLIASPIGVFIQYRFDEPLGVPRSFTVETAAHAALWMFTTAVAFGFALGGKIHQHRQWMTRSYALAILFLENRVIVGLFGWSQNIPMAETVLWVNLSFSLFFADIVSQWRDLSGQLALLLRKRLRLSNRTPLQGQP
jgi:uncharacterized membrane protein